MATVQFNKVEEKMLDNRVIAISTEINPSMADNVMKQLLYLNDEGIKPIKLYISSPGGDVRAGLTIIDTMNSIRPEVHTINVGLCASMGAVILSAGAKRMSLPHARVMIHQVSSGTQGKIFDQRVALKESEELNEITMGMLAENCGKTFEELIEATPVDKWMSAQKALEYGIIDEITGSASRKIAKEILERRGV